MDVQGPGPSNMCHVGFGIWNFSAQHGVYWFTSWVWFERKKFGEKMTQRNNFLQKQSTKHLHKHLNLFSWKELFKNSDSEKSIPSSRCCFTWTKSNHGYLILNEHNHPKGGQQGQSFILINALPLQFDSIPNFPLTSQTLCNFLILPFPSILKWPTKKYRPSKHQNTSQLGSLSFSSHSNDRFAETPNGFQRMAGRPNLQKWQNNLQN